ncbi:hypothetical protein V8C86DRAFT_2567706 [Haematococcus lacustris]
MRAVPHGELHGEWLLHDFITREEEVRLQHVVKGPPAWSHRGINGPYRGKAWGVVVNLAARSVSAPRYPLPQEFVALAARMRNCLPLLRSFRPSEANAIAYTRGVHQLTPHMDDRFLSTELIVTLSLVGRARMTFQREASKRGPTHRVVVELPPRACQVLSKDARYTYTHAIASEDLLDPERISITFRQTALRS